MKCGQCGGLGGFYGYWGPKRCDACDGTGKRSAFGMIAWSLVAIWTVYWLWKIISL